MRYFSLVYLIVFLLLSACEGNTRERRAARGSNFVSDPDHLYFLNVRSRDYRSVTLDEGVEEYRHDDLPPATDLVIIDRWLHDRAELLLNDQPLSPDAAAALSSSLKSGNTEDFTDEATRSAARETLDDYLRLIAYRPVSD